MLRQGRYKVSVLSFTLNIRLEILFILNIPSSFSSVRTLRVAALQRRPNDSFVCFLLVYIWVRYFNTIFYPPWPITRCIQVLVLVAEKTVLVRTQVRSYFEKSTRVLQYQLVARDYSVALVELQLRVASQLASYQQLATSYQQLEREQVFVASYQQQSQQLECVACS